MEMIYLLSLLLLGGGSVIADYTDEFRIHEGASIGTPLTASPELKRKLDRVTNCFSTLDTSIPWIELKDTTNVLWTTESLNYVNLNTREQLQGVLTMMCPGNKVIVLPFSVHITKMNRHAPSFKKESLEINVPLGSPVGALLTQLEVTDYDAVIYNSQRTLSFKDSKSIGDSLFSIQSDGSINLKASIPASEAYKRMEMQVVAVDYGSPQRYSETNITMVPVTVSQVRNLRVNVASDKYQIFEWEAPEYGIPDKYRLVIRRGEHTLVDEEVDAKANRALTRVKIGKGWEVTYSVSAVSFLGETASPKEPFTLLHGKLECVGECSSGGLPLCYYGPLNSLLQYEDQMGKHCDCFPGYTGVSCEKKESCASEKRVDTYGGLDWPETGVNASARLYCPYNEGKTQEDGIWRPCEWNSLEGRAQWGKTKGHEKCQSQTSILMHLGMHANFAEKADQISAVSTVSNYLLKLLAVPSFATSGPAHFDLKIAQHMTLVLDAVTRVNYTRIQERTTANVSETKLQLLSRISTLSSRLPIPFQLGADRETRNNISFNVIHWLPATENFRQQVGESCYLQLPMIDDENVLRAVCMANSSLVNTIDQRNPVLMMTVDSPDSLVFSKITFGLKTFNASENYTCVYYDEMEKAWSNRGIRRVSQNRGYVECETSHLSMFSILPESTFTTPNSILRDLAVLLPTVTSFIAIVCGVFLLFLAAIQRGPSIDYPLLVFLFLAFIIHALHLLTLLAPQLGDPFLQTPTLHLVYQFCVISVCALLMLQSQSIYSVIMSYKCNDDKPDPPLCSSFCSTLFFGIIIPALLTSTTYFFAQQNRHELTRVFTRLDWLFILNFLSPSLLFVALTIVFCFSSLKAASNCSSRGASSLSLSPASHSSSTLLILIFFLLTHIVLFVFRSNGDGIVAALFVLCQLAYCLVSFIFAGYLFRLRYIQLNGDELSTRSIETKSRAVLSHVDRRPEEPDCSALLHSPHNPSDDLSTSSFGVNGCKTNGNTLSSSYYQPSSHPSHNQVIVRSLKSTPSPPPHLTLESPNGFSMTASLFERAPMVSIV